MCVPNWFMKTVLNQLCVEKEGERERKGREEERREDLRGVVEVGGGIKRMEGRESVWMMLLCWGMCLMDVSLCHRCPTWWTWWFCWRLVQWIVADPILQEAHWARCVRQRPSSCAVHKTCKRPRGADFVRKRRKKNQTKNIAHKPTMATRERLHLYRSVMWFLW